MAYEILVSKKVLKTIEKMPAPVQKKLVNLIDDLRDRGPLRSEWPNYSKLGADSYHCHLAHKWVACWQWRKQSIIIEVYYAGSRENAPY
jgi:mRNA-degrading endonuclease RelE of RelBE toxin-antitoxin system